MRLKVYKLKNINKTVCCVEQKLAYNIAFRCHINYQDLYDRCPMVWQKCDLVTQMIHEKMAEMQKCCEKSNTRYNPDALQVALQHGLRNYMEHFFIASSKEVLC